MSLGMTLVFLAVSLAIVAWIFRTGYRLKARLRLRNSLREFLSGLVSVEGPAKPGSFSQEEPRCTLFRGVLQAGGDAARCQDRAQ